MKAFNNLQWFTFAESEDGSEKAEILIGIVPQDVIVAERAALYRTEKQTTRFKDGERIIVTDTKVESELGAVLQALAIRETRNFDIDVPDSIRTEELALWSTEFGKELKVGDEIRLDGHLQSKDFKRSLIRNSPAIQNFVGDAYPLLAESARVKKVKEGKG